ncbi:MAG: DUF4159 domain-containing protein [Gemmatimonadetes bacterium]|nr:DUF4159 domain-containing protein [Gemmatimonadota bacterium]
MRLFAARPASVLVLLLPLLLGGQGRGRGAAPAGDNLDYNGRFVFSRIRYDGPGGRWGWGGSTWSHDYPRADRHLPQILRDLTTIDASVDGSNVFRLDDGEVVRHPIIYLSEPGFWAATESELNALRAYLLKGGFIIFDDFENDQILNLQAHLSRALPEYRMIEIGIDHPIFNSFFHMKEIYFPHPMVAVTPRYYALFEHNDPRQRMLAIINHNNDLAEYWEWSATGMFPLDITNEAYKLGVNYIVYGMTH